MELLGLEDLWMEEPGMPGIPRRWRRQPGQDRRLEELIQLQPRLQCEAGVRPLGLLVLARDLPGVLLSQGLSSSASVELSCSPPSLVAATTHGCRPSIRAPEVGVGRELLSSVLGQALVQWDRVGEQNNEVLAVEASLACLSQALVVQSQGTREHLAAYWSAVVMVAC